jgi:hypothetical protein
VVQIGIRAFESIHAFYLVLLRVESEQSKLFFASLNQVLSFAKLKCKSDLRVHRFKWRYAAGQSKATDNDVPHNLL